MNFNPYSRTHRGNPHPAFAALREERPVHLNERPRFWAISRYDDVQTALRDWPVFSSSGGITLDGFSGIKPMIILMDPPRQARLRKVLQKAFTVKRMQAQEGLIRRTARDLLSAMDGHASVDLVAEFTAPFPIVIIAELLGIDPADRGLFKDWSNGIMSTAADDYDSLLRNYDEIFGYFGRVVADRRNEPRDDLVTALVEADVDGVKLDDDDILGFCALLLIAGNETTTNLLGNTVIVLAGHAEVRAEVVDDLSQVPATIEEVLRFEGPVPTLSRTVTADTKFGSHAIDAGEKVMLLLAAANRDPRVFEDPDRFDIHRRGVKHLEFGSGVHFCMGANLARLEAKIALEELLSRFPRYSLTAETVAYFNTPTIRGPSTLPVMLNS